MSSSDSDIQQRICFNQFCANTECLVSVPFSNQSILFCPICVELYKKKRCCYLCAQVYRDDQQSFLDGKNWVQCDNIRCGKWTHIECEDQSIERQLQNKSFKYKCPWCRILKQQGQPIRRKKQEIAFEISDLDPDYTNHTVKKPQTEDSVVYYYEPIIKKNTYLEELLKKYGEFSQCINADDLQSDLIRLRSIVQ